MKLSQVVAGAILLIGLGCVGWVITQGLQDNSFRGRGFQPTWQVVSIHDGDTIKVRQGNRIEKIRFACLDAPELSQPLGKASRDNLQRLIDKAGNRVNLEILNTDRYGRKIAEVYTTHPQQLLQEAQIKSGLAYVYHQYLNNCPDATLVKRAEAIARHKRAGVWHDPNSIRPWNYRRSKRLTSRLVALIL